MRIYLYNCFFSRPYTLMKALIIRNGKEIILETNRHQKLTMKWSNIFPNINLLEIQTKYFKKACI